MFCPVCKTEYRDGFFTCADCSVPLVYYLSDIDDAGRTQEEFIEILSTRNPAEVAVIKSIFESESIVYYFLGEQMMASPLISGGGPARLFIAPQDLDIVKELLGGLEFEEPDLFLGVLRKL